MNDRTHWVYWIAICLNVAAFSFNGFRAIYFHSGPAALAAVVQLAVIFVLVYMRRTH